MKYFGTLALFLGTLLLAIAGESFDETKARAEKGNADAQYTLGWMYIRGAGVPRNVQETARWFRMAAEQNLVEAQFHLGVMYAMGTGVTKDVVEALKWLRRAGDQGFMRAQACLGEMYISGTDLPKDATEACRWFRMAAMQGEPESQCNLGLLCAAGDGVPRDAVEAVVWYRKAAEQGYAAAQYNLGSAYYLGAGLRRDLAEAAKWFLQAALRGYPAAQANVGVMYNTGRGLLKDEVEALAWFNIAAISGDKQSKDNRDILERQLGRSIALLAQQRGREILAEIENKKMEADRDQGKKSSDVYFVGRPVAPKFSGSGAIVTSSGYILTAAHVVAGAARVSVVTESGANEAKVVRVDEQNDLAVLKIAAKDLLPLPVVTSRGVRLGQPVATIGFPNIGIQGFSPKLTRGEISSLNGIGDDPRSWQISVPVQPGNSGGPLLDANGNLIGVVASKLGLKAAEATSDLPQNVAYAVKSAYALALLEPYLESDAPAPKDNRFENRFEEMVAVAQHSTVLVMVY